MEPAVFNQPRGLREVTAGSAAVQEVCAARLPCSVSVSLGVSAATGHTSIAVF